MNLLDPNLMATLSTPETSAPLTPVAIDKPLAQPQVQPQEIPSNTGEIPTAVPNPQVNVETLPIGLSLDSAHTGNEYIRTAEGNYMIGDQFRIAMAMQGVGDATQETLLTQSILEAQGNPYETNATQGGAMLPTQPLVTFPTQRHNPGGFDINDLTRKVNPNALFMVAGGVFVCILGTVGLLLMVKGLRSPEEALVQAYRDDVRSTMGFVERTQKANAKIAANAKGASSFCIGNCPAPAPSTQPVDPNR